MWFNSGGARRDPRSDPALYSPTAAGGQDPAPARPPCSFPEPPAWLCTPDTPQLSWCPGVSFSLGFVFPSFYFLPPPSLSLFFFPFLNPKQNQPQIKTGRPSFLERKAAGLGASSSPVQKSLRPPGLLPGLSLPLPRFSTKSWGSGPDRAGFGLQSRRRRLGAAVRSLPAPSVPTHRRSDTGIYTAKHRRGEEPRGGKKKKKKKYIEKKKKKKFIYI